MQKLRTCNLSYLISNVLRLESMNNTIIPRKHTKDWLTIYNSCIIA